MTGKPYLKEIEGFVFPARVYSTDTGRWITKDPLGFPDGKNQFTYVQNDPVNHIDPLGTFTLKGFPVTPTPRTAEDNHSSTSTSAKVLITAHSADPVDERAAAQALVTAANPTLPAEQRYVPSSVATVNGTLTVVHWRAGIYTGGISGGGDMKATYAGLPALGADNKSYKII